MKLSETPVDMVELNISCPNVKEGGASFGVVPESVEKITSAVRARCSHPLIVKLTPNTADIAACARAAVAGGADAISLINTITAMAIDADTMRPVLGNITGGLSGPAIKPVALRMVYEVSRAVAVPVIGMGGIRSGRDAAEFILAGATAVMVGTATIADPLACVRIIDELKSYLSAKHMSARTLRGALKI
jgi:dihydroorotate dehydrogenase (NAD+) catalytic subunit